MRRIVRDNCPATNWPCDELSGIHIRGANSLNYRDKYRITNLVE